MRRFLGLFICIGIIFSIAGCSRNEQINSKELYVPVLGDEEWLTEDSSFLDGVYLAIDEMNAEYKDTGYSIKTSVVDDKALYEKGVEMATKLSNDKAVTAVLNLQNFDVSKTTADILSQNQKMVLFPYGAYDNIFQKENPYLFCGVTAFSDLGKAMASYALEKGCTRIAIYHNGKQSQEELVTAFEITLKNSLAKVVDYVPEISSTSDFEAIYSRWSILGVDCVIIAQYGLYEAYDVLKMIREKDSNMMIIGEPIFNRANALAENKEIAEGLVVPSTLVFNDGENIKDFKKKYEKRYQKEADIWAIQGYDMIGLIMKTAVKLGTNDSSKIAQAIHNGVAYQGLGRDIAFNKGGSMVVDISKLRMLKCKNGMFYED